MELWVGGLGQQQSPQCLQLITQWPLLVAQQHHGGY